MNRKKQKKIIARAQHSISRAHIDKNALKVLYRLHSSGYAAYLVGGGVRDLLVGLRPKDFDIVTNARPEEIRTIFSNCILVGRRFRLAHIRFGGAFIEVATFRGKDDSNLGAQRSHSEQGMLLRDNIYGTMEEDVWRRDFTINALYYNIDGFTITDYVGGMQDLHRKVIRMIGDPVLRYHEDPVRMLRALRLAAKLGFTLARTTRAPITKLVGLLQSIAPARMLDEVNKWFMSGKSLETWNLLRKYQVFAILFPQTAALLNSKNPVVEAFISQALRNTDKRIIAEKPLNPAFLLAVFLWWPLQEYLIEATGAPFTEILLAGMRDILRHQQSKVLISKRLSLTIKEIWLLQYRLEKQQTKRIALLIKHPRFRIAYDFLLLRAEVGESAKAKLAADFWTKAIMR